MTNFITSTKQHYHLVVANPFPSSTIKEPVYHGTSVSFNQFEKRPSKRYVLFSEIDVHAQGFFFSESITTAKSYVDKGWVVECHLDLKNPLLDPRRDKHLAVDKLPEDKEDDLAVIFAEAAEGDGDDKVIQLMLTKVYVGTEDWIYHCIGRGGVLWDLMDNPKVVKKMVELGYDGCFVDEPNDEEGRSIFVTSEKQIKMGRWIDITRIGQEDAEDDDNGEDY